MSEFQPHKQLAHLRQVYARMELLRRGEIVTARAARVSQWSVGEHLAHLSLANELAFRNVRSLMAGTGLFVVDSGEPVQQALAVLESGVFPRGIAQAPRMVRPPADVAPELLDQWIDESRAQFEAFEFEADQIRSATKRIPHQLMGPLSAAQWLRFAAIHSDHHTRIAEEVAAG